MSPSRSTVTQCNSCTECSLYVKKKCSGGNPCTSCKETMKPCVYRDRQKAGPKPKNNEAEGREFEMNKRVKQTVKKKSPPSIRNRKYFMQPQTSRGTEKTSENYAPLHSVLTDEKTIEEKMIAFSIKDKLLNNLPRSTRYHQSQTHKNQFFDSKPVDRFHHRIQGHQNSQGATSNNSGNEPLIYPDPNINYSFVSFVLDVTAAKCSSDTRPNEIERREMNDTSLQDGTMINNSKNRNYSSDVEGSCMRPNCSTIDLRTFLKKMELYDETEFNYWFEYFSKDQHGPDSNDQAYFLCDVGLCMRTYCSTVDQHTSLKLMEQSDVTEEFNTWNRLFNQDQHGPDANNQAYLCDVEGHCMRPNCSSVDQRTALKPEVLNENFEYCDPSDTDVKQRCYSLGDASDPLFKN